MIKINKLLIDNVDYSDYATMPLQEQDALDESFDIQYIELNYIEKETPFEPFSDVFIQLTDDINTKEFYMFIESDTTTEIISNKTYLHKILVIEQTKWTERFFIEKSVTNPLVHNFIDASTLVRYDIEKDNISITDSVQVFSPIKVGTDFVVPDANTAFNISSILSGFIYLWIYKDDEEIFYDAVHGFGGSMPSLTTTLSNITKGKYKLIYQVILDNNGGSSRFSVTFYVIDQKENKEDYTIKDSINLLLNTCETLRMSETPKFSIANIDDSIGKSDDYKEQIIKILNMESPEFYFSKMSLFEALKTIGDYCHFIPRIKNKKVYLDLLGRTDKIKNSLEDYCSYELSQTSNEFCSKLDSQVNNLVNLDDEAQGSITTPFNNGYKTLRTDIGEVIIGEDNIIIPTEYPIEKVVKLEIGYLSDGTYVGDITPYVYEDAEYQTLSSYEDIFPISKMYAIKYTQGQPNITGLSFQRQNVISDAFEGIAIKNIIYRKINETPNWWKNLFDFENTLQLQYRLTYIPNTSTRITQSKAYKSSINKTVALAYNQSASKLSSNAYGENLKGQVLKLGNVEKRKMYILPTLDLIPECGMLFDDDYYISIVKCEYYPNFIKCELGLSKHYNNKSAYVEVNSQIRFYEISEKIAVDRFIVYEDYCEVGYDNKTDNLSLITNDGLTHFANAFVDNFKGNEISLVKTQGFDRFNEPLKEYVLPTISLGIGNSLLFEFHYEDNYSAGSSSFYDGKNKVQQMQKYCDLYGEIETLQLKYGKNNKVYGDYESAVNLGNSLPNSTYVDDITEYFSTGEDRIVIKKDNREIPHFTYQIHFVSNNNDIIIGSGLARKSTFVTSETMNYKLYLLKNKINKFESEIDLTNATLCDKISTTIDYENKKVKLNDIVAPLSSDSWKSWVIVQTYNNKNDLIIGENKNIQSGDTIVLPNFVFKHKIVED